MTTDRFTKILLTIVAAMFFINLLYAVFTVSTPPGGQNGVGQYLISSWSAQSGAHTYQAESAPGPAAGDRPEGNTDMRGRGR